MNEANSGGPKGQRREGEGTEVWLPGEWVDGYSPLAKDSSRGVKPAPGTLCTKQKEVACLHVLHCLLLERCGNSHPQPRCPRSQAAPVPSAPADSIPAPGIFAEDWLSARHHANRFIWFIQPPTLSTLSHSLLNPQGSCPCKQCFLTKAFICYASGQHPLHNEGHWGWTCITRTGWPQGLHGRNGVSQTWSPRQRKEDALPGITEGPPSPTQLPRPFLAGAAAGPLRGPPVAPAERPGPPARPVPASGPGAPCPGPPSVL